MLHHPNISDGAGLIAPIEPQLFHADAAIEWWFIQGRFEFGPRKDAHFMLSVFRHAIDDEPSYSLLFRFQDSSGKNPYVVSRTDARISELLRRSREESVHTNFDKTLLRIYFEEVERYGLPACVSIGPCDAVFGPDGANIRWGDFSLRQEEGVWGVEFLIPEIGVKSCLVIRSRSGKTDLAGLRSPGEKPMGYWCYPHCDLSGRHDGCEVSGRAWFDHQWGEMSWFVGAEEAGGKKKLLGWEWFGINLDDGSALVILVHRDMKSGKILADNLMFIGSDGVARRVEPFTAEAMRTWYSAKTGIDYPVEWRITIPSENAELFFRPLDDDQEIPVSGLTRAIWEGAGNISGTLQGHPVRGTARLELNGYGYVFDLNQLLGRFSQRIAGHIEAFFPPEPDVEFVRQCTGLEPDSGMIEAVRLGISEPMWDLLRRGGKYWRPLFGLLMTEMLGLDSKKYEDLLTVTTELTHLASLVIDDIEDNAATRRNAPCIHLKYGLDVAINAANTLYFLPILKLRHHPFVADDQALQIYAQSMSFFVKAHIGQGMDIFNSKRKRVLDLSNTQHLLDDALHVCRLKSSSSVEFVTHAACILARADEATTHALTGFAKNFGMAFQIKDDIHDFARAGKWTKNPGDDLACGKITYVIALALQRLQGEDLAFMENLLSGRMASSGEPLERGLNLVRQSGALELANEKVLSLLDESWEALCRAVPQSEARILLRVMCEHLLKLDFDSFDITA